MYPTSWVIREYDFWNTSFWHTPVSIDIAPPTTTIPLNYTTLALEFTEAIPYNLLRANE